MGDCRAKRISVTASGLTGSGCRAFDPFCLPPGPEAFIPNPRLRALQDLALSAVGAPSQAMARTQVSMLLNSSVRFFAKTRKSEERILQPLLDKIVSLLCKSSEIDSRSGECVTSRLSQVGGFQLASPTSRPGSVLMYETWILLGSEAAGIHASQFKALAQGCQVIGDGALLLERAGLPLENCAVPGIVAFGDSIQVYGAYLAPSAFPVFCLLSSPTSMSSRAGIASIASWICFLRDFVAETARLLKASTGTTKPQSACYLMPVGTSRPPRLQQNLFYKPIRLRNFPPKTAEKGMERGLPYRVAMTRALEIFRALFDIPQCHQFVIFPLGYLQMPGSEQADIRAHLTDLLTQDGFEDDDKQTRQPYFIFPRAQRLHKRSPPRDRVHRDLYVAALRRAVEAFQMANVVHLDLRPANVLWGCSCGTEIMTSDDEEEDLCETKQQQQQQHEFVLKVIDWEDAFFEGEVLPLHIVTAHIEDRYRRYTLSQYNSLMGRNRILAACWMDHWMADTIDEFLSEDRGTLLWADYMAARKEDPTVESRVALISESLELL